MGPGASTRATHAARPKFPLFPGPCHLTPQHEKSEPRALRWLRGTPGWVFSRVGGKGGNWAALVGPWAVARGVGKETRHRLALALGGCTAGIPGTPSPSH